ncbi:MAG TPA: hypothetical protein VNP89_08380 [Gaiellaceae bacterium]|nr:hypothetical protein [Gaiellaceae bacterium]
MALLADMRIGELLDYEGTQYIVRGLDPMGVPERRADLEHVETGERIRVPIAELDAQDSPS